MHGFLRKRRIGNDIMRLYEDHVPTVRDLEVRYEEDQDPKSRKNDVAEEYEATIDRGNQFQFDIDIYKNPSQAELLKCITYGQVRCLIDNGSLYMWKDAIHEHVRRFLKLSDNFISLNCLVDQGVITAVIVTDNTNRSSWYHNPEIVDEIRACKYLKFRSDPTLYYDDDFIGYYDQDRVGRWEEL